MIGRAVAVLAATAVILSGCQSRPTMVNIYENEDLSDSPYSEPINVLTVTYSAGTVCYANDSTGQDTRQMYVRCADAKSAGAHILPAS